MSKKAKNKKNGAADLVPVYAAVDVGSNNVRMDLYGVDTDGRLVKIEIDEETSFKCKLADSTSEENPGIKRENLTKAVGAMKAFDAILTKYRIQNKNTMLVMTEAIRAAQETAQGKKDFDALIDAFNQAKRRITAREAASAIITKREEALLVCEAAKLECLGRKGSIAVAAIGGGSVQAGIVKPHGSVSHEVSLPYGIHKLLTVSKKKLKGGKKQKSIITTAGDIFETILHDNYHTHRYDTLVLVGGYWRALGEAVCQRPLPAALHGKDIHEKLFSATQRSPDSYMIFRRARDRAEFMPLAAAMARRVAKHFDAKEVIFSDKTIRDAMAHHMHARNTGAAKSPPPGLERLFSP